MCKPVAAWHQRIALHAAASLLLSSAIHRVRLSAVLTRQAARLDLKGTVPTLAAWHLAWADLVVAAVAAALLFVVGRAIGPRIWARRALVAATLASLVAVGLIRISHLGLLVAMHSGLTFRVLADALMSGDGVAVVSETTTMALAWALPPMLMFVAARLLPERHASARVWLPAATLTAAVALVAVSMSPQAAPISGLPDEAPWPPAGFTAVDMARSLLAAAATPTDQTDVDDESAGGADGDEADDGGTRPAPMPKPATAEASRERPSASGRNNPARRQDIGHVPLPEEISASVSRGGKGLAHVGMRWSDPRVVSPVCVDTARPDAAKKPVNVVWVIMESTGTRYAMGEVFKARPPMPFLQELARSGWYLSRHRSASNSSATSIVSQMSGLLPLPSLNMMSVKNDNYLPGLPSFLTGWDRFLVTPGKLSYFFPRSFFLHNGMTELWGFKELPDHKIVAEDRLAKDEIATVDFFLQRLDRAKEPFFGVYYSYMPHWEYTDYGVSWRRYRGPRLIDHYHNGLWLLDNQLRRIFAGLRKKGILDRTLVVLVGDHGEAFGQHKKNWAHAKGSWEENLQTPAILWAPGLLKPRTITAETSHIDLLPTVLDLLAVPYEPRLFQGESLLQQRLRRKVSLHWGNEATVSAIHIDGTKVQVSLTERWCRAYDLRADPRERRPKSCNTPRRAELRGVLRAWVHSQRKLLGAYNQAAKAGRPFENLTHPGRPHPTATPAIAR